MYEDHVLICFQIWQKDPIAADSHRVQPVSGITNMLPSVGSKPFVFYVNADKAVLRKDTMELQLNTLGLPHERIAATMVDYLSIPSAAILSECTTCLRDPGSCAVQW